MLKYFTLTFCLFFGLNLFGQNPTDGNKTRQSGLDQLKEFFYLSDSTKILEGFEEMLDTINADVGRRVVRDIGFGYEHHIWWKSILEVDRYEYFSFIVGDGEIISIELRSSYNEQSFFSWSNQLKVRELISLKDDLFKENSDKNDLDLLLPLKTKMFGYWCGAGGEPPEYRIKMLDLVNDRNKVELNRWLLSFDPEIQVYGAEGLLFLNREGIRITEEEKEVIDRIWTIDNTIISCQSCSFYERHTTRQYLSKKSLRINYRGLKSSGWLYNKFRFR